MLQRSGRAAGLIEPCLPSPAKSPPAGPDWLREIKRDGFRIMALRDAAGVRLYTLSRASARHGVGAFFVALSPSQQGKMNDRAVQSSPSRNDRGFNSLKREFGE